MLQSGAVAGRSQPVSVIYTSVLYILCTVEAKTKKTTTTLKLKNYRKLKLNPKMCEK